MRVLYTKGTRIICPNCNAHCATVAQDLYQYGQLQEASFDESGQGPWRNGDELKCRQCQSKLYIDGFFAKVENNQAKEGLT